MALYDDIAAVVSSTLATYGVAGTLSVFPSSSSAVYDPTTSTNSPGSPSTFSVNGVLADFPPGDQFFAGTVIQQNDKKWTMEAKSGVVPKIGDEITVLGTLYKILNVLVQAPTGIPMVYTLHLRK